MTDQIKSFCVCKRESACLFEKLKQSTIITEKLKQSTIITEKLKQKPLNWSANKISETQW